MGEIIEGYFGTGATGNNSPAPNDFESAVEQVVIAEIKAATGCSVAADVESFRRFANFVSNARANPET